MRTNTTPSSITQRSRYALTTFLMITTSAAPTTGPSVVAGPPAITISSTSAEFCSESACGLMNVL